MRRLNGVRGPENMNSREHLLRAPVIFIGPGRSGSTIISEFVLAHEDLAWPSNHLEWLPDQGWLNLLRPLFDNRYWRLLGEKGQLNRTRQFNNLLPRPAEAYPFWERITREGLDFSRGFLLGEQATPAERRRIRRRIARLVAWQGKKRFAMKITGPGRIAYLHSLFPDACFVNVVRDPAATVHSMLKVPFWQRQGMNQLWWRGGYSEQELARYKELRQDPVAGTAFQLAKVMETIREEAESVGARMLTVQYEDFIRAPGSTVREIMDFCSLPESAAIERKLAVSPVRDRNHWSDMDAAQREKVRVMCG